MSMNSKIINVVLFASLTLQIEFNRKAEYIKKTAIFVFFSDNFASDTLEKLT